MADKVAPRRADFAWFRTITTRWMDNDAYGHVNNVVYYSYFDTVVNDWLIRRGLLDFAAGGVIGLVVETGCHYFESLTYPETVTAAPFALTRVPTAESWTATGGFAGGVEPCR